MATHQRLLRVHVETAADTLRRFLSGHALEVDRVVRLGDRVAVDVFMPEPWVDVLRGLGAHVDVLFDATERSVQRQREVGRGNRFADGRTPAPLSARDHRR